MGQKYTTENSNDFNDKNIINEYRLHNQCNINLRDFSSFCVFAIKSICIIKIGNEDGYGTGFFCKIPYPNAEDLLEVLITNNHVLNKQYFEFSKTINLEIDKKSHLIDLNKYRKIWTNEQYDYTIVEIKKIDNIQNFLFYDTNIIKQDFSYKNYQNESIIVPSFIENKELETDKGNITLTSNNIFFFHNCNTVKGSSGGPIIDLNNYKVIGVHKGYQKHKQKKWVFFYVKY